MTEPYIKDEPQLVSDAARITPRPGTAHSAALSGATLAFAARRKPDTTSLTLKQASRPATSHSPSKRDVPRETPSGLTQPQRIDLKDVNPAIREPSALFRSRTGEVEPNKQPSLNAHKSILTSSTPSHNTPTGVSRTGSKSPTRAKNSKVGNKGDSGVSTGLVSATSQNKSKDELLNKEKLQHETVEASGITRATEYSVKLARLHGDQRDLQVKKVASTSLGMSSTTMGGIENIPIINIISTGKQSARPLPLTHRKTIDIPQRLSPNLTGPQRLDQDTSPQELINRMADAMVASSLASTRSPLPSQLQIQHDFRHRSKSAHNIYRIPSLSEEVKKQALPKSQRPMRHTLRKQSSENDQDELDIQKRGRRHLVRKHPNMHNEGDRKRWRDKITELERRRYEGVFAANRGLLADIGLLQHHAEKLIDPQAANNQVVNVVAKDIWERSRLSPAILKEIYALVAPEEPLQLNREQFVVGLWLIDQKLKGRKLPAMVHQSVWNSIRHTQGIKIRKTLA